MHPQRAINKHQLCLMTFLDVLVVHIVCRLWMGKSVSSMMMNIPEGNLFHINFHARFCHGIFSCVSATMALEIASWIAKCVSYYYKLLSCHPLLRIYLMMFHILPLQLWFYSRSLKHGKIIYARIIWRWSDGKVPRGGVFFLFIFVKSGIIVELVCVIFY